MIKVRAKKPSWYHSKPPKKKNKDWKREEQQLVYDMRRDGKPVIDIIKTLGNNVTPTQVHNQARMVKKAFAGKCFRCGNDLIDEDLETRKVNRTLHLCKRCQKTVKNYKRKLRKRALKFGLCGICMKRKVLKGHTACQHCISACQRRRIAQGLCGACGRNRIDKKRSVALCSTCLDKNAVYSIQCRKEL